MAISRAQLVKELEPGLNALFGLEYKQYGEQWAEIFDTETSDRAFEEEVMLAGFANASVKPEGQGVQFDQAQETFTARYTNETVALAFANTEEAIEDNLYDRLASRYTKALARSMASTKNIKGAAVLNNAFDSNFAGGVDWSTGTSNIQPLVGVFNGIFYINSSTSKPTFANHVLASTTFGTDFNTGSSDGIGFVNDNPMQEYTCKADAAVTQANLLSTFNPTDGATAGTHQDGQSTVKLNIASADATSMFRIVRTANDPANNDNTAANSNVVVQISPAASISN